MIYFINTFQTYYAAADKSPELINSLQLIVSTTGTEDEFSSVIDSYTLYDTYPNPFNPSTTMRYQIPKAGFVTLMVYDLLGNEVARLVNEEKPAGSYEVKFSTKDELTSGVYFYRLQAGGNIETKKMLLMK
jgi:hypothetical protein